MYAFEIGEYLDIKKCSCKNHLLGKLVLTFEDEMLNTTEASFIDKKVTCARNNCLNHTISLIIFRLFLLVAISIT